MDCCRGPKPFELVNDGDLLSLIDRMLRQRGLDTVSISKVKGHADDGMVLSVRVRREDKLGNDAADEAAGLGRRRVSPAVIDARRNLSGVCNRWYPVILDLHRFFIAISRAVVGHDGRDGTVPDPLVWSAGALPKRRRLFHAVRDRAFLHGPPGIWCSEWYQVPAAVVCDEDIVLWPYTPGLLVKWVSFLNSIHWPIGDLDLGVLLLLLVLMMLLIGPTLLVFWLARWGVWTLVSVVFLMWSCLLCMSFGLVRDFLWKKLTLAIFVQGAQFQCRLFLLVQALIFGARVGLLVL